MPNYQGVWSLTTQMQNVSDWPVAPTFGFFASQLGSGSNFIHKITIETTGNAQDVGDLTVERYTGAGGSSLTRGVFAGGYSAASSARVNTIDYITMATAGDASDFGDLSEAKNYLGGASNSTRALFAGGADSNGFTKNVIDYITIASTGNSQDFGDLTVSDSGLAGCASSTRALFAGGYNAGSLRNVIQYNTIASTGNSTDFGDLTLTGMAELLKPALAATFLVFAVLALLTPGENIGRAQATHESIVSFFFVICFKFSFAVEL